MPAGPDLTMLLTIEARDKASAVIDNLNSSLTRSSEHLQSVGATSTEMGASVSRAFGETSLAFEKLEAHASRLSNAELQAKLAAMELRDANEAVARGAVGAYEAQQAALDNLTAAEGRYAAASREAEAATKKVKDAQELEAAQAGKTATAQDGLSKAFNGIGLGALAATVGIGILVKHSVDAAMSFETTTAQIANSANISSKAAQQIGDAFTSTAGQTTFSAQDMAAAYGKVAGQLGLTAGHALSTKEALDFMNVATTTAEASGQSLGSTTTNLAKIMQAFGLNAHGAADAANAMYNASRVTGVQFGQFANQLTRMKSQLGALAPSISDTATFMVDLTKHGVTGRQAMMMMNTVMTQLTKTSAQTVPTTAELAKAFSALPPQMQDLAQSYENGQISAAQYQTSLKDLPKNLQTYGKSFMSLVDKSQLSADTLNSLKFTPAQQQLSKMGVTVFNSTGSFVGMRTVIEGLSPKINALTGDQAKLSALQPIFGNNSRKMLGVIEGGSKSWDKYSKAVKDGEARQKAAERASTTFKGSMERLHGAVKDAQIAIGNALLPAVTGLLNKVIAVVMPIVTWIEHNKKLAGTIATVAGSVTAFIGTLWAVTKVSKGVYGTFDDVAGAAVKLAGKMGLVSAETEAMTLAQKAGAIAAAMQAAAQWALDSAISVFEALTSPIGLIIMAIVAALALLATGIYELVTHWKTVWNVVKSVTATVWHFIYDNVFKPMKKVFEDVAHAFLAAWHFIDNNVIHPLVSAFSAVVDWIRVHWMLLVVLFTLPLSIMVGIALGIWKYFHTQIMDAVHAIVGFVVGAFNVLKSIVVGIFHLIVDFIMLEWHGLLAIVDWINQNIVQPIGHAFNWLWHHAIEPAINAIVSFIQMEWNGLVTIVTWIFNNIIQPIGSAFTWLWQNAIQPAMNFVVSIFEDAWHGLTSVVSWITNNIINPIVGLFEAIPGAIGSALSTLGDIMMGIFHAAFDAVALIWNNSVAFIPGVPEMHWNDPGQKSKGNTTAFPKYAGSAALTYSHRGLPVPGKAAGGATLPNQAYLIGENGPEIMVPGAGTIIPNHQIGGQSVVVNVHLSGHVYGSLNEFANELGKHLATNSLPNAGVVIRH